MLEIWGMRSTPLLSLLPGPLWLWVVAPDRDLSVSQIELNRILMLNWICEQFWTSPGGNSPQDTNYTATFLLSWKLSKLDEPDMQDTAGEAGTSS